MERTVRFATTSRGVQVAWSQVGSGPVLLAPPGWVSHIGHLWDDPASRAYQEALAQGHTLVTFDRPGTGLSDLDRTDFSMEEDFAAMEAVIAAQGASRLSLLGTSQGGVLACLLAARRPELVEKLVLYGAFARGLLVASTEFQSMFVALVRKHWGFGSRTLAQFFVGEGADDPLVAESVARFQREAATGEMAAALLDGLYRVDVRDHLARIRAPTLVLHREHDQAISAHCGRDLAAGIAAARFVSLPGAAHLPWVGDWESIVEAIRDFLGDPPRARSRGAARGTIEGEDEAHPRREAGPAELRAGAPGAERHGRASDRARARRGGTGGREARGSRAARDRPSRAPPQRGGAHAGAARAPGGACREIACRYRPLPGAGRGPGTCSDR